MRQLLAARLPSYRLAAGLAVSGEGKPAEVAEAVLAALRGKMADELSGAPSPVVQVHHRDIRAVKKVVYHAFPPIKS